MKNEIKIITVALFAVGLSGCASITGTTNQSVSLQARDQSGKEVTGANCDLTNNKGTWFVTTPGSVSIHRSNDDLQVLCKKDGLDNGRVAVVSDTKGSMFGNIVFGGGVGAIIDHSNGSAYEYPTLIQVVMGAFSKIESPKSDNPTNANPMMGAAPSAPVAAKSDSQVASMQMNEVKVGNNEEKLKKLKQLYDQGLVTQEVYAEEQKKILEKN